MDRIPGVSVVVSFLNAEKYIEEAIQSVCNQTYKDWELLLVDDGSTEDSSAIALRYAASDAQRVRYFEHPAHQNRGLPASRNLGLMYARGKYVAVLDADDVWLADKLSEQIRIVRSHPEAVMVCGNSQYWYSWTDDPEDALKDFVPPAGVVVNRLYQPPSLLEPRVTGEWSPCPSDLLFKRQAVLALGGFEESFAGIYGMYEDQAFLTKVCLYAPVFVAGSCWTKYRMHSDSICAVQSKAGNEPAIRRFYLKWLDEYLANHGVVDRNIWRQVRRAQWAARHSRLSQVIGFARSIFDSRKLSRDSTGQKRSA
jgi:glycosyltransferase involved in cell wall biosynthesis